MAGTCQEYSFFIFTSCHPLKQLKKENAVKTHIKFKQRQVEAVDLRRRKQVGLKAFPECHNRGAIAYVRGQGVP